MPKNQQGFPNLGALLNPGGVRPPRGSVKPPGSIKPIRPSRAVVRSTGSQGQDLGFRGFQPSFGGNLDPSSYGPNRPPYISQANQGAYRPDETQGFRAYEGAFAQTMTALGMNPGNPAPGAWDYVGDPSQGYRPYEGPGAGWATDRGVNPGFAARGAWDYSGGAPDKNGVGTAGKSASGGSIDMMALLRQLAQQQGRKGPRRPGR